MSVWSWILLLSTTIYLWIDTQMSTHCTQLYFILFNIHFNIITDGTFLNAIAVLTSSNNLPSTRSSQDAMLPSESSVSGLAGLKVLEMYNRSFRFCYKRTKSELLPHFSCPLRNEITYLHWSFERLLYIHSLPHNGLVKFSLKGQEVHVCLGLWHQFTNLREKELCKRNYNKV